MKKQGRLYDSNGDSVVGTITVFKADSTTKVDLYSDDNLDAAGSPGSNPLTTRSDGLFELYVEPGEYKIRSRRQGRVGSSKTGVIVDDLNIGKFELDFPGPEQVWTTFNGGQAANSTGMVKDTWYIYTMGKGATGPPAVEKSSGHFTYSEVASNTGRLTYDADPFFQSTDDAALFLVVSQGYWRRYNAPGDDPVEYIDTGYSINGADPTVWTRIYCTGEFGPGAGEDAVHFCHHQVLRLGKDDVFGVAHRAVGPGAGPFDAVSFQRWGVR